MTGCVVGRDEAEVAERLRAFQPTVGSGETPQICGTVDQVVATLREYEAAGVDRVMLQHMTHEDVDMVAVLGEVASQLP